MFEDKNEIIPGFWIGNYKAAHDFDYLKENDIRVIINCTPDIPFITELLDPEVLMILQPLDLYRIPVYDSLKERDFRLMEYYLQYVIPYLYNKYIKQNKNVLVHCRAGKMRSGCVGLSFLYYLKNYSSDMNIECGLLKGMGKTERKITDYMLKRRPVIFGYGFRNNFRLSFRRFFDLL